MKLKYLFVSVIALLFPVMALAADFNTSGSIGKTEKPKNLYTAGQTVSVDADVTGDLTAAGSTVTVDGNVENNLQAAAGTLIVKGSVGKNARLAGGNVTIDGNVGSDLVIFGGQVNLESGATVSGDLLVFGGTVVVNGDVNGKIYGSGGNVTVNGKVGGDVNLMRAGTVTLGSKAVLGGAFTYSANSSAKVDSAAKVVGETKFTQVVNNTTAANTAWFVFFILGLIGSFLAILVLSLLFPKTTKKLVEKSFASPWANLGIGFVTLVVVPIAAILAMILVVGFPVAMVSLVIYGALLALSGMLSGLLFGSLFRKVFSKSKEYDIDWLTIVIGVLLVAVLKLVPVVGWLIVFGFFLIAVGAVTRELLSAVKFERK